MTTKNTDNSNNKDIELIKSASESLQQIVFKDGTSYFRMPNGQLVRSSKRAYIIRKEN
jgi:hypothetical protein